MGNLFNNQASRKRAQARRAARARESARKNGGRFESIKQLKSTMRPGELRFGLRPLGDAPGFGSKLLAKIGSNPLDDVVNLESAHEHIVYMNEDGVLKNIGFTGPDRGVDVDLNFEQRVNEYNWGPIQDVNLNNINFYSIDFQSSNYHVIMNNCQDYCTFIRKQL